MIFVFIWIHFVEYEKRRKREERGCFLTQKVKGRRFAVFGMKATVMQAW
jgi:hypothetical protein